MRVLLQRRNGRDILKLVPYALKVIEGADFELVNPDIVESPFVEFGEALAREVSGLVLR